MTKILPREKNIWGGGGTNTLPYGTPEGTFPFKYLAENKLDSILFKQDPMLKKKRHYKSFKRLITSMLFYFLFCFLGLVFSNV